MAFESTLRVHTEPPAFREEQFTLPPYQEGEFGLELRAVELISEFKYALRVEPETRLWFANYLQSESFRLALKNGRKTVNVGDVIGAYNRIYDS